MRWQTVVGVILLVLGVASFLWGGIPYTKKEQVVDFGPIHATAEKRETVPLPPILGLVCFAGGIVLLISSSRRSAP